MENEFKNRRPKAFLGSLLGAVGGIAGSIIPGFGTVAGLALGSVLGSAGSAIGSVGDALISSNQQDKAAARQKRAQIYQNNLESAKSMNAALANTEYQKAFKDRFSFKLGGNIRKDKDDFKPSVKFVDRSPKLKIGGFVR